MGTVWSSSGAGRNSESVFLHFRLIIGATPGAVAPCGLAMHFEILSEITGIETFATGSGIREIARLRRIHGRGRWRKRKGIARVRLSDGSIHVAELHWYEAAGIGRKEFKIKHLL
jgi:hypothetical protein